MQGYTAMMHADEENAIALRNRHKEIFESCVEQYRGNIIQYFGDGTLTTFDSSVDAVSCALTLQKAFLKKPVIPVRIGIHVGDIVVSKDDIIGDAVNIASRIESVGKPGSVLFSGHVNDQLRSHVKFRTKYLDVFQFKNVKEAIPVFALVDDQIEVPESSELKGSLKWTASSTIPGNGGKQGNHRKGQLKIGGILFVTLVVIGALLYFTNYLSGSESSVPNRTIPNAMAILPVQNLSGLSSNDIFCESISNELLQQLSGKSKLSKVVPNSLVHDLLERGEPIGALSSTLGVRYILEVALHQSDSLYNLDMRLVDQLEQKYLWSDRYAHISEGNYIPKIQTVISEEVVSQISNHHPVIENTQGGEVLTTNKRAYDLLLKADQLTDKMNKESFYQAIPLYEKAVQLDPELAEGYRGLGRIYIMGGIIWGIFNQDEAARKSKAYLTKSMTIKPTLEASQFLLISKFFFDQDFAYVDDNLSLVAILPAFPDGAFYTVYCNIVGRFDESIRYAEKYVKRFPEAGNGFAQLIRANFLSGKLAQADSLMDKYDQKFWDDQFYLRDVAMVHLNNGNMDAFRAMNHQLKTNFLDKAAVHLYYDAVELTYFGGNKDEIKELLKGLQTKYDEGISGSPAWFIAMYHLYSGDEDTAFKWLQKSHERKEVEMAWFKTEYLLQPYRKAKDPRYMAIYNQINWPD